MEIDLGAKEEVSERRERNFVKRCIDSVSTEVFAIFVKERSWRVVAILGVICGMILVAHLTVNLGIGRGVPDVPSVTAVLVSPYLGGD